MREQSDKDLTNRYDVPVRGGGQRGGRPPLSANSPPPTTTTLDRLTYTRVLRLASTNHAGIPVNTTVRFSSEPHSFMLESWLLTREPTTISERLVRSSCDSPESRKSGCVAKAKATIDIIERSFANGNSSSEES